MRAKTAGWDSGPSGSIAKIQAEWRARMDPSLVALVEEGQRMSGPDVARALMRRHDLWLRVHAFFGRYDLLATPV